MGLGYDDCPQCETQVRAEEIHTHGMCCDCVDELVVTLTRERDGARALLREACDGITLKQTIGFTHIKVSDAWTRRAEEACGG